MNLDDTETSRSLGSSCKFKKEFTGSLDDACNDDQRQTLIVSLLYQFRY
jgi:hypothetical protein